MIPLLIGAAIGAAKYKMDQDKEARQRRLQAETQRYSPWTRLQDQAPTASGNPLDIASGALAGHQFGSQFKSAPVDAPKGDMAMNTNMEGQELPNQSPWLKFGNTSPYSQNGMTRNG